MLICAGSAGSHVSCKVEVLKTHKARHKGLLAMRRCITWVLQKVSQWRDCMNQNHICLAVYAEYRENALSCFRNLNISACHTSCVLDDAAFWPACASWLLGNCIILQETATLSLIIVWYNYWFTGIISVFITLEKDLFVLFVTLKEISWQGIPLFVRLHK
jgi:hypothetical protein